MGLSTYMTATKGFYESMDSDYSSVAEALEDIVPIDFGVAHNATRNIEITIPIATWHKASSVDDYLWQKAGMPESDECYLDLGHDEISEVIKECRRIQEDVTLFQRIFSPEEDQDWMVTQFQRLERALTDFLLDDRLKGWTLKVWRSY